MQCVAVCLLLLGSQPLMRVGASAHWYAMQCVAVGRIELQQVAVCLLQLMRALMCVSECTNVYVRVGGEGGALKYGYTD